MSTSPPQKKKRKRKTLTKTAQQFARLTKQANLKSMKFDGANSGI